MAVTERLVPFFFFLGKHFILLKNQLNLTSGIVP